MAADETRPAGINNEPGVATAECAEPTVDTSHTADQTLQCCSQPLLQITRETPYSHYLESENTHCSTLLQREWRVHWGLSFRRQLASELRCEAAALFYFRDQTESRELMTSALSTDQSSGHCLLLHHLTHHLTIIIIQHLLAIRQACNYKIGSQDDRKSSTNQNLDRSFKRQNGMVLISPPILFSHKTIVSLW